MYMLQHKCVLQIFACSNAHAIVSNTYAGKLWRHSYSDRLRWYVRIPESQNPINASSS